MILEPVSYKVNNNSKSEDGYLKVLLQDGPGNFQSVMIDIQSVGVKNENYAEGWIT